MTDKFAHQKLTKMTTVSDLLDWISTLTTLAHPYIFYGGSFDISSFKVF